MNIPSFKVFIVVIRIYLDLITLSHVRLKTETEA